MRKRHWLSRLLSGALWAAWPAASWAQAPDAAYVPYIDPNTPQAAQVAPAYPGYEAAGWPQGATQWPYISPHTAPPFEQTSYQNGFWFNEQRRDRRKYFTYLGATLNSYADPDDVLVGDPDAPRFYTTPSATGGNTGGTTGTRLVEVFEPHDWSQVEDTMSGGGFMGILGWMNPDDTGVYATGFWAEEGTASYTPVSGGDPDRPLSTLRAVAGIPLFDGQAGTELPVVPPSTEPVFIAGGGTQPYDSLYKLAWQSQAYGIGGGFYANPIYSAGSLKLRPVYGARYLNIRENATFDGEDSGLNYTIDTRTRRPTTVTTTGTINNSIPLESQLRSNTKAQLAGPEIGLKMDLGGEKFKLQLQSKLGILANHSTRELDGYGIGRTFQSGTGTTTNQVNDVFIPIPDNPNMPSATNPTGTGFHDQESTTSVSPTFEQSIMISAPILQYVPLVNKVRMFEEANFNLGYTWLVAGGVYRPGNVIDWKGYPNFPELNGDKTTWFLSTVTFGVEWNY